MKKVIFPTAIAVSMLLAGCAGGSLPNTYQGIKCNTIQQPGMAESNRPGCEK